MTTVELVMWGWLISLSWLVLGGLSGWILYRVGREKMYFLDWLICIGLGYFTVLVTIILLAHEWLSKQDSSKN